MRRARAPICAFILALAAAWTGVATSAQTPPEPPPAPLLLVRGDTVAVAWRLPAQPRPLTVVLYRRPVGGTLTRVGEYPAEQLSCIDKEVQQGRGYEYAIAVAYRKGPVSAISHTAAVNIGGGARVLLKGGSVSHAVFEVTMYDQGRKVTAEFVTAPGEVIGDISFVKSLERPLDFRLGAKLLSLELADVSGMRNSREAILDPAGKPMADAAGQPLVLDFKLPGETREVLVARVQTRDGRAVTLNEGDSIEG